MSTKTCPTCKGTGFRRRDLAKLHLVNCSTCAGVGVVFTDPHEQKEYLARDQRERREDAARDD